MRVVATTSEKQKAPESIKNQGLEHSGGLGRNLIEAIEASTHALFPSRENGGVQAGVQVPKNNKSGPWFDSNMPITVSAVDVARS